MITGFQFKAAKKILNITSKEIANIVCIHEVTLARFNHTQNLDYIRCQSRNITKLKEFFTQNRVLFYDNNSIKIISDIKYPEYSNLLTRFQLVCARIATGLSQKDLGVYIRVSHATISKLEGLNNAEPVLSRKLNNNILKDFFERLGVVFEDQLTVSLSKDPQSFFKKRNC